TMRIALLIFGACLLALIGGVYSECCTTKVNLEYKISSGGCGAVGGRRSGNACKVTICGNGAALVGTYCGKGPCNWFGCACRNGCLQGNWVSDFLARNKRYNIDVLDAQ
ncbi:hypothetical protein KR059_004491, partial [Drosophila kikkawai]